MITKTFNISLDINSNLVRKTNIELVQGDTDVYIFNITMYDDTSIANLSSVSSVTITFLKSDNNSVVGEAIISDVSNGLITYQLGTSEISQAGNVLATVELYGSNGERLTSNQFQFTVRQQLNDGTGVTSTTEYPILTDLISQTQDIINNTDGKIGTQTYTEQNYVTNGESLTESVDSLDIQVKNNTDNILNHENRITTIESQNLDGRVTTLENDIQNANYTDTLTQTSSIFSVGTGYKDDGTYLDVSSSVVNGQVNVTKIRAISSVEPFYIKLLKNEQEVLSKYINVQLNSGEIYDCDIKIPNFIGADKIVIDSNDEIEITYTAPLNLASNIDGLNDEMHAFANHKTDNMPHKFQDNDTGKTYKYGFKQENGFVVFMYEEVI